MNIALVLSGGTGMRMGIPQPKQYLSFHGRMVITRALELLYRHEEIHAVQVVAHPAWQEKIKQEQEQCFPSWEKFRGFSSPGENRQLSILHGLRDIARYADSRDVVMVHDAVRPFLREQQISDCLAALPGHDGVMPVLPMKDTVYCSVDGKTVSGLLERSQVFAGQAPEFFLLGKYLHANESLPDDRMLTIHGSTEPAILSGMDIAMVPGDEKNFKITTQADWERYRGEVAKQEENAAAGGAGN